MQTDINADSQLDQLLSRLQTLAEMLEGLEKEERESREEDYAIANAAEEALQRAEGGAEPEPLEALTFARLLRKRLENHQRINFTRDTAQANRQAVTELAGVMAALGHTRAG